MITLREPHREILDTEHQRAAGEDGGNILDLELEATDTLHGRGISTFMVTNAQFPDQMETLKPCTQLYISVDAPTQDELKAVDRPLFTDFWERFLACVDLLRAKKQRTVFRMTLVNGWNTEQLSKKQKTG